MEDLLNLSANDPPVLRILNTLLGSSVIGIVREETKDSFLVELPGKLMREQVHDPETGEMLEETLVVRHFLPVPQFRIFKSTLLSMLPVYDEFEYYYLHYLLAEASETHPGILTDKEIEALTQRLEACDYLPDDDLPESGQATGSPEEDRSEPSEDSFFIYSTSKSKH